jgi:hypothetical protein
MRTNPAAGGTSPGTSSGQGGGNATPGTGATQTTPGSAPPRAPEPGVTLAGTRQAWQGYSFIVPPTMTGVSADEAFIMSADASAGQGGCAIILSPEIPATGDLLTQALQHLNRVAAEVYGGSLREGGMSATRPPSRGVSGAGWRYAFAQGEVLTAEGFPTDNHVRVLLVDLGATVATITGIEAANNRCLGALNPQSLSWQWLFYSLDFPAFAARDPNLLASQVFGIWAIGGNTTGLKEIYAANGRYGAATTLLTYQEYSATEVLQTATTFGGQGAFNVSGDRLSRFPDNGPAETVLFRIEQEMNQATPSGWLPRLYQLQRGSDGNVFEYALTWRGD